VLLVWGWIQLFENETHEVLLGRKSQFQISVREEFLQDLGVTKVSDDTYPCQCRNWNIICKIGASSEEIWLLCGVLIKKTLPFMYLTRNRCEFLHENWFLFNSKT
jgi:hypothetical protein